MYKLKKYTMRQKKFSNKPLVLNTKNTLTFLIVTYFRNQNALHMECIKIMNSGICRLINIPVKQICVKLFHIYIVL